MFISDRHEWLLPFPTVPEAVKARYSIGDLALRPFGLYESDLSVDFNRMLRPFLVTEILECCTIDRQREKIDQGFFWSLTVGKRIECLLNLACAGESPEFSVALFCPANPCGRGGRGGRGGRELEVELALKEVTELQEQAYEADHISIQVGNEQLRLRRPTGSDQLAWLSSRFPEETAAVTRMFHTLLLPDAGSAVFGGETIPKELVEVVGRTLDEHDPLINFSVRVHCPDCEEQSPFGIDLETLALGRLRQAQIRLLGTVHCLAEHYHWNEREIFAVPYWRRAYYLRVIETGKNQ